MTVVFRTRQGPLAARVDSVGDVLEIDPTQLAPVPSHGDSALHAALRGLFPLPDSLLLVLDAERLLGDARPSAS
jgi:purine-binding chemotaxis protein CheW